MGVTLSVAAFFGRFTVYAALIVGAVLMVFPFYWMFSTSLQSRQEAGSTVPILYPNRMQPANWAAAWGLGIQTGGGVRGGLLGGWVPGNSVEIDVWVSETEADAGLDVVIPRPSGVLTFPLGSQTETAVEFVGVTEEGEAHYRVTLTHAGETRFERLPVQLRVPRTSEFRSATIAADSVRNTRTYQEVSFDNVASGALGFIFSNYTTAWRAAPFGWYFFNSAFTATVQVLAGLIVASLAAFALARIPFWGRDIIFVAVIGTLMIPGEVLLIPNYVTLARLDWINKYPALIVPFVASAFGIFLLRQFFMTLPQELFDAARIDGASWFTQLVKVALPLATPGLLTYALFSFLGSWNALLWPLIVTSSERMRTIQVGLRYFVDEAGTDYGSLMAASTLAVLPIIIGFMFVQKQFIQGIARSGLK